LVTPVMVHIWSKWPPSAALLLVLCISTAVFAQDINRAALIVSLGDGEIATQCVEFEEKEITGYELLNRSELAFESNVIGLGASVCRIQGIGCPSTNCFCQCKGSDCFYWSYWHVQGGEWYYSQIGATVRPVGDGDIEGWVWGIGTPNEAPRPPQISFEDVCGAGPPGNEMNGVLSETADMTAVAGNEAGSDETVRSSVESGETATEDNAAQTSGDAQPAAAWYFYGVGGLALMVVALIAVRSKRGREQK